MDNKKLYMEILDIVSIKDIKCNEQMKNHTTLKVGGNADYLIEPRTEKQLVELIRLFVQNNIPYYVIGRGSNLLVKDEGVRGVIIKLTDNYKGIDKEDFILNIKAGTPIAEVSKYAYKNKLTGLEFASGIPGTIGGAVAMNAGAYGGEIKDIIVSAKIIDDVGNVRVLTKEELNLSYRHSIISENPKYIVLSVQLELKSGNQDEIYNEMYSRAIKRTLSQPLDKCNCGSTFKRPKDMFAGKLIEECGLKGYKHNGVEVSDKHAGFIVNNGQSTATDMLYVIDYVRNEVKNKFGIVLETEVKII